MFENAVGYYTTSEVSIAGQQLVFDQGVHITTSSNHCIIVYNICIMKALFLAYLNLYNILSIHFLLELYTFVLLKTFSDKIMAALIKY